MKQNIVTIYMISCLAWIGMAQAQSKNESLQISGNGQAGDTIDIRVWDQYFSDHKKNVIKHRQQQAIITNGQFAFHFEQVRGPIYFSVTSRKGTVADRYLAMPGDSIHILRGTGKHRSFYGRGADGMSCRYKTDSIADEILQSFWRTDPPGASWKQVNYLYYQQKFFAILDSMMKGKLSVLLSYRALLPWEQYQVLKADIIGNTVIDKTSSYQSSALYVSRRKETDSIPYLRNELFNHYFKDVRSMVTDIPEKYLASSRDYILSRIALAKAESNMYGSKRALDLVKEQYKGMMREKLLVTLLLETVDSMPRPDSVLRAEIKTIQTAHYKEPLQLMLDKFVRGVTAYNFTLENAAGKMVQLRHFAGKKVLIDYWYTGCTGCVQFFKGALHEVEKKYATDSSMVFLSISIDKDKKTWLKSINDQIYTSPAVINLYTGKLGNAHPAITNFGLDAYPTFVIVDKNGKIQYNGSPPRTPGELISLINAN